MTQIRRHSSVISQTSLTEKKTWRDRGKNKDILLKIKDARPKKNKTYFVDAMGSRNRSNFKQKFKIKFKHDFNDLRNIMKKNILQIILVGFDSIVSLVSILGIELYAHGIQKKLKNIFLLDNTLI